MSINIKEPSTETKTSISIEQINSFDINKIKEFNTKSVELIIDDKIESGLEILKKIENFLETNAIENNKEFDKKIIIIILHNLASCYQKIKDYKNCIAYLEAVIYHLDSSLEHKHGITINSEHFIQNISKDQSSNHLLGDGILELRFSAKFHLQMCAVLSQAGDHEKALNHAKLSSLMCEDNLIKTYFLFKQMEKTTNINDEEYPLYEEQIKQSEGIIKSLYERVLDIRNKTDSKSTYATYDLYRNAEIEHYTTNEKLKESIRKIYGVIEKDDWIQLLNIGNIMYLSALKYDEFDLESDPKYELLRDAILEKTIMLTVSYFCIATEMRLSKIGSNNGYNGSSNGINYSDFNGHFWHQKAVEFSSLFLPVSCPIIKHYITSYEKHYGSNFDIIPEKETLNNHIEFIRSEIEIDKDPMIFIKCSKVIIHVNKKEIQSCSHDAYGLVDNKIVASMSKIKEDIAPKFKLDFFHLKKDSNENDHEHQHEHEHEHEDKDEQLNNSHHSDRLTITKVKEKIKEKIRDSKSKTDRIKINNIFTKNGPVYNNNSNNNFISSIAPIPIHINNHNKDRNNTKKRDKKSYTSREKKPDNSCQTHRQFIVNKKDLLIKTAAPLQFRATTSRIITKKKNIAKPLLKLNNDFNQLNMQVHTICPANKPKIKDSGIYLIDKLLSNQHRNIKGQGANVSYNTASSPWNSLLKSFQHQKKVKHY